MADRDELECELRAAGETPDDELDIAPVALALALLDCPHVERSLYDDHLDELVETAGKTFDGTGFARLQNSELIAKGLSDILAGQFSYQGDSDTYDDPKNANLIQVIDRRKGLPVTLGILYLHVAQSLGFDICGLNFPGHFVLRLQNGASAAIIDPFNSGAVLTSADLLELLRSVEGPDARLLPESCAPVTGRDILLRLQNNILGRAIRAGELDRARDVVTRMIWLAPRRSGLHFELGRIEVHAGRMTAASTAFGICRDIARDDGETRIAGMADEALRRLKTQLN